MRTSSNSEHYWVLKWTPEEELRKAFPFHGLVTKEEKLYVIEFSLPWTKQEWMDYALFLKCYELFYFSYDFPFLHVQVWPFSSARILPLWILFGNGLQLMVLEIFHNSPSPLAFAGFQLLLKEECISTHICVASLNLLKPADPRCLWSRTE